MIVKIVMAADENRYITEEGLGRINGKTSPVRIEKNLLGIFLQKSVKTQGVR